MASLPLVISPSPVLCTGGWHQEGDSSVTGQWLSFKCHNVWGPADIPVTSLLALLSSGLQPVLTSPKISTLKAETAEVSCRHAFGAAEIHNKSHFLMADMLIGVFLGGHYLAQRVLETWHRAYTP